MRKPTEVLCLVWQHLLDRLYPARCPYCDSLIANKDDYACPRCKPLLPNFSIERFAAGGYRCAVPLRYDTPFSDAVKRFKFRGRAQYAPKLAFVLTNSILELFPGEQLNAIDAVVCVPMHKHDLKKRGYNQAELLARECAALLALPFWEPLEKTKYNQKQHNLSRGQRLGNVRGVYRCIEPSLVKGKTVLLVDDIITTGATLGACAKALKAAGAKAVYCAPLCTVVSY